MKPTAPREDVSPTRTQKSLNLNATQASVNPTSLLKQKQFTMIEQDETIKAIWQKHTNAHYKRDDIGFIAELPLKPILNFFVKEGIGLDRDKAKQALETEIGPLENDSMISYSEFNRLFQKGIFKTAIIRTADTFEKAMANKGEIFKRDMTLT